MPQRPKSRKAAVRYRRHDQRRRRDGRAMYGRRWAKARRAFLSRPENALCRECRDQGAVRAATEVDHKIPHKGDPVLFWDEGNWQPLCKPHHSAKTAREDGGFGNGPS